MIKLNKVEVNLGKFPNKESFLKIEGLNIQGINTIAWMYEGDHEFFELALIKSYIDSVNAYCILHILYMPYSRMDRANGVYVVSCPVATKLINDMKFKWVMVREPHSKVCMSQLTNSQAYYWSILNSSQEGWDSLFFPDYGAKFRYGIKEDCAYGKKTRDFESGNIESYTICGKIGERVLIIDDLCSRGGTFVKAAKLLREHGAKSVGLVVAMCEENVHTGELFDYIDRLYTSKDCILTPHPRITLI